MVERALCKLGLGSLLPNGLNTSGDILHPAKAPTISTSATQRSEFSNTIIFSAPAIDLNGRPRQPI